MWTENDVIKMLDPRGGIELVRKNLTLAIAALYYKQTEDEKAHRATFYRNEMGFNSHDASYFTKLAKYCVGTDTMRLIPEDQITKAWEKIMKYKKQLASILQEAEHNRRAQEHLQSKIPISEGVSKTDWMKKHKENERKDRIQNFPKSKVIPDKKKNWKPKVDDND